MKHLSLPEAIAQMPDVSIAHLPRSLDPTETGVYIDATGCEDLAERAFQEFRGRCGQVFLNSLLGSWVASRGLVIINGLYHQLINPQDKNKVDWENIDQNTRIMPKFWHYDPLINNLLRLDISCFSCFWNPEDPYKEETTSGPETVFGEVTTLMSFVTRRLKELLSEQEDHPELQSALNIVEDELSRHQMMTRFAIRMFVQQNAQLRAIPRQVLDQVFQESLELPGVIRHSLQPGEVALIDPRLVSHGRAPIQEEANRVHPLQAQDFYKHDIPYARTLKLPAN